MPSDVNVTKRRAGRFALSLAIGFCAGDDSRSHAGLSALDEPPRPI